MAYYLYFTILVVGIIFVGICASRVKTSRGSYLKILFNLMIISVTTGIAFVYGTFFATAATVAVAFFLYYSLNTWRNLYFLFFAYSYVNGKPLQGKRRTVCYTIAALDTLFVLWQCLSKNELLFTKVPLGAGEVWMHYGMQMIWPHMLVSLGFLAAFLIFLARHFAVDPRVYRMQFAILLALMAFAVVVTLGFSALEEVPMDFSCIIFGIIAASMSYLTEGFISRYLIRDMNAQVLIRSHAAVLLFGEHNRLMYINDNARALFPEMQVTMEKSFFRENYLIDDFETLSGRTIYLNLDVHNQEETCYLFEYQELFDKRQRFEGSFFILTDLTSEERQKRERLLTVSRDYLTGLLNESGFYEKVSRILLRENATDYQIITTNIRQFKLINELMGREMGDLILTNIGEFIRPYVNRDVAASRLEGDHFALCIPKTFDVNQLEKDINDYLQEASVSLSVICDFGVYEIRDTSLSAPLMCENANMALDAISDDAQIRIAYYNDNLREQMISQNELIADLDQGLREHEFVLYYQPQVDSFSEKVVGAEVLVRWEHPKRGFLTPFHFVELFEEHGRLYDLDAYVWEEAACVLKQLRAKGYPVSFSVNISPKDIFNNDLTKHFVDLVNRYDIEPSHLKLEITETAVIMDLTVLKNLVKSFQEAGFIVEMDDFGSGYSSLNSLKDIPVDIIKTDRVFLTETEDLTRSKHIFEAVLGLARTLGSPIIAEGVETKEQLEYLRSIGCHNIQGYYYSPPVPLDEFIQFMDEHGVDQIKL